MNLSEPDEMFARIFTPAPERKERKLKNYS